MGANVSSQEDNAWLESAITQLTPSAKEYSNGFLRQQIGPVIKKSLSKILHREGREAGDSGDSAGKKMSFDFEEIDFGSTPPRMTNIRTHPVDEEESQVADKKIVIDFDLVYSGDCHFRVAVLGMPNGVRDIAISGRVRAVLIPTSKSFPFVGGIQLYFLDEPAIEFDLEGLVDICDKSVFRRKIRRDLMEDIGERIVFPNRITIPTVVGSEVDPITYKCFDPTGILMVKVASASGLPRKKGIRTLVGQDKPDTYVKVRLGSTTLATPVVKNEVNPSWEDEFGAKWFDFLLERRQGHVVRMEAYDHDSMSRDDFLGYVSMELGEDNSPESGQEVATTLDLQDDPNLNYPSSTKKHPVQVSGSLSFVTKWLPLKRHYYPDDQDQEDFEVAVLTVFVYSCNNLVMFGDGSPLPGGAQVPDSVRVTLSRPGGPILQKSEKRKKTPHPTYEEGFTVQVPRAQFQEDKTFVVQVLETESGGSFGQVVLDLGQFANSAGDIKRKVMPLSEENPILTITLSAFLRFA